MGGVNELIIIVSDHRQLIMQCSQVVAEREVRLMIMQCGFKIWANVCYVCMFV